MVFVTFSDREDIDRTKATVLYSPDNALRTMIWFWTTTNYALVEKLFNWSAAT